MKKVIIIAMLLALVSVCGLSAGVCFADTATSGNVYYFESTTSSPYLYMRASADPNSNILLYIPHSYAFEVIGDTSGTFITVKYNSIEGYITADSFNSNCKQVTSKWGDNPTAYEFPAVTVTASQITLYNLDNMSEIGSEEANRFRIDKVYGFCYKGNDCYLLADTSSMSLGSFTSNPRGYVKALDTSLASFNGASIPESAGYKLQTAPENDSSVSSGNVSNNPSAPKNTSNAFERYILIAVIAVLCVVIVILIFAPAKKRRS